MNFFLWVILIICIALVLRFILLWCIGQLVLMGWWFPKIMEQEKKKRLRQLHNDIDRLDKQNDKANDFFTREALKNGKH